MAAMLEHRLPVIGEAGWMQTYTGKRFEIFEPTLDMICLQDIARSLSMQCRYNGHTSRFYSVAEHSVLVSKAVPKEDVLWGLLHDATEAYMGDILRPIKRCIVGLAEAEATLMDLIAEKFGLTGGEPPSVKEIDTRILIDERNALMGEPPSPWFVDKNVEMVGANIIGLLPAVAESEFLRRYEEIS